MSAFAFQNLSIRTKVMLVAITASLVAVLAVAGGLYMFQRQQFRSAFERELRTLARIMAENSAVAVAFNDPKTAAEVLSPLAVKPEIRNAGIITAEGKDFAKFGRKDERAGPENNAPMQLVDRGAIWTVIEPITLDGKRVGTFFLDADFGTPNSQLQQVFISVTAAVLAGSLLLVVVLTYQMQKFITRPIHSLATASNTIARARDYSVRVEAQGTDEVGVLTEAFNGMLVQIQSQDCALQTAQDELRCQLESLRREVCERERAQAAQARLTAIINVTPDFVGSWEPETGHILYLNPAARQMLGLPLDAEISLKNISDIYSGWAAKLVATEGIPSTIHTGSWDGETALLHSDGREIHVSQVIIAHRRLSGEIESFSTVMRDISERKAAEEALRKSQQKLLETSRLAGMAEVATGVLHNVGNVLNSVNVSGNLLSDTLRNSKSDKLTKVAELIEEQGENIGTFITSDSRGKSLPGLVVRIAAALQKEQRQLLSEVDVITSHIGHIKQIVSTQQNFARVGGVLEPLDISTLVEDALTIGANSLERHRIELVKEFQPVPTILADKHKVLQILVNLIRNAKQAIEETDSDEKRIIVRIERSGALDVEISVIDTGRGIEANNLVQIFSHGFTTKKTGHGFGLHSGALAAKEMGGSLRVESDGIGKGATFTLSLPVARRSKSIA